MKFNWRFLIALSAVLLALAMGCSDDLSGEDAGDGTDSDVDGTDSVGPPTADDGDGDGVANTADNCPDAINSDQADIDLDGIGDACDNCPTFGNASQLDADDNGIGDGCEGIDLQDLDSDGVTAADNCPTVENPDQLDQDSDGIGDACDNCAAVENPFQDDADFDGIGDYCEAALELPLGTPLCASGSSDTVRLASNLYLLIDISGSMTWSSNPENIMDKTVPTRWGVVTAALDEVSNELAAGFNIGMGLFPARSGNNICATNALPDEILPMQAGREGSVISNSYTNVVPNGNTPTSVALEQVLSQELYKMNNDKYAIQRATSIVLITDGDPNSSDGICNDVDDTALAKTTTAAQALADAGIPVYVIGVSDVNPTNMESIAAAGGGNNPNDDTRHWFPAGDVESLRNAITTIADASIGCSLAIDIDDTDPPDWNRASVVMNLSLTESMALATDAYTLDRDAPATMTLNGDACSTLQMAAGSGEEVSLEIRVACASTCGSDEICGDSIDNNCNGEIDEGCDVACVCIAGTSSCGGDCPEVIDHCVPAVEICDEMDNDCDGFIDEDCCTPAEETCDGVDNDCDGSVDEGCDVIIN